MPAVQHSYPPLRILSGPDSLQALSRELARVGARRAAVICGRSVATSGLIDKIESGIGGGFVGVVTQVRAHSPISAVQQAATELDDMNADAVIAVGGGSAMVTGRAAAILLSEDAEAVNLATHVGADGKLVSPRLDAAKLPQFAIPTTPNTAMVKAGSAIFDADAGRRLALFDPKTRAGAVFLHRDLLMSAPQKLVITASLDTLTLAIEGLLSHSGDLISDGLLIQAVKTIAEKLQQLVVCDDTDIRTDLAMGAVMAGRGTDQTGAGLATVIGHAIGAGHEVDNGTAKAVVLPEVLKYNSSHAHAGIDKLAFALGVSGLDRVLDHLNSLFGVLGVPPGLRNLGVPDNALESIADLCLEDWFTRGNPRPIVLVDQVLEVLTPAW